jgi:hypothetical protein
VKEDVRKRRTEREKKEKLMQIEFGRRKSEYERLFQNFYLSQNGRLEILVVKLRKNMKTKHRLEHNLLSEFLFLRFKNASNYTKNTFQILKVIPGN